LPRWLPDIAAYRLIVIAVRLAAAAMLLPLPLRRLFSLLADAMLFDY